MALIDIRAVLFDLDGTLVDSAPDIGAALNTVLSRHDLPGQPLERVLSWIGEGPERLVERALVHLASESPEWTRVERLTAEFLDAYHADVCRSTRLYPGVREMLDLLAGGGFSLACVTNKTERLTRSLMAALELDSYFPVTLCADTLARRKPAPEPLWRAAELLSTPVERCLMVGDSVNDVKAARAAGCPVAAVCWGYGRDMDALDVDALVASPSELTALVSGAATDLKSATALRT